MEAKLRTVTGITRSRWETAIKDKAYDLIGHRKLVDTRPEEFRAVLNAGTVATNVFLRKLHNLALDMECLLGPVLVKPPWSRVKFDSKRAINETEHRRICAREANPERRTFHELCSDLGGSQGDIAPLSAEQVNGERRTVGYRRHKTGEHAEIQIGTELEALLRSPPVAGPLFPNLRKVRAGDRATEFKQRCCGLGIAGVTLHSCLYAWAPRAKALGYPERFAQQALGHGSKAVLRAYAKGSGGHVPSLDARGVRASLHPRRGEDPGGGAVRRSLVVAHESGRRARDDRDAVQAAVDGGGRVLDDEVDVGNATDLPQAGRVDPGPRHLQLPGGDALAGAGLALAGEAEKWEWADVIPGLEELHEVKAVFQSRRSSCAASGWARHTRPSPRPGWRCRRRSRRAHEDVRSAGKCGAKSLKCPGNPLIIKAAPLPTVEDGTKDGHPCAEFTRWMTVSTPGKRIGGWETPPFVDGTHDSVDHSSIIIHE